MRIGAHLSSASGYLSVLEAAEQLGVSAVSFFRCSPRTYWPKKQTLAEAWEFRDEAVRLNIQSIVHTPYLINLCHDDKKKRVLSIKSVFEHLKSAYAMGVSYVVTHVGSHGGHGLDWASIFIRDSLNELLDKHSMWTEKVTLLLENSAGGGNSVAGDIEYLWGIVRDVGHHGVGLCLDTAHAYAAGLNLRNVSVLEGLRKFEFPVIHLNMPDSKVICGKHLDRHNSPLQNELGESILSLLEWFPNSTFILERKDEAVIARDTCTVLKRIRGYSECFPWCSDKCNGYVSVGPFGLCRL